MIPIFYFSLDLNQEIAGFDLKKFQIIAKTGCFSLNLQRVFHSIRFKVNKGRSTAVLLFLCLKVCVAYSFLLFLWQH